MRAAINFITLAVEDLNRSLAFYRDGLRWPSEGIIGGEFHDEHTGAGCEVVLFEFENGLTVCCYERRNLALDAGVDPGPPGGAAFALGLPAEGPEHVDRLLAEAAAAGATIPKPPHLHPFGVYSGYFADPDGNLWEVAWNPARPG